MYNFSCPCVIMRVETDSMYVQGILVKGGFKMQKHGRAKYLITRKLIQEFSSLILHKSYTTVDWYWQFEAMKSMLTNFQQATWWADMVDNENWFHFLPFKKVRIVQSSLISSYLQQVRWANETNSTFSYYFLFKDSKLNFEQIHMFACEYA